MEEQYKNINITTPIYYASGEPHLGHAYTTILADAYKKYNIMVNNICRLETGTDEHGLKIERLARRKGISNQDMVDELAYKFKEAWEELEIDYDDFLRTTEKRHIDFAKEFWRKLEEKGDIYLGQYEGLYCVDCEQYYSENELLDNQLCPIHHKKVELMKEESYFFRLSKYHDWLVKYIEENEDFIVPVNRRNEMLGFLKIEKLKDFSISRTSFSWGIPVPDNEKHIMYVWMDALTNYISSLGGCKSENYSKYWKNTIHFVGKDILRFHAIYWICMLKAAELPLPKRIVAHGWWTISDRKISKSDPATKVNPVCIAKDISVDGLRFYLLKETSLEKDGNFDYYYLIESLNTFLANKLGNLVNRTLSMINKYINGKVKGNLVSNERFYKESDQVIYEAKKMRENVIKNMDSYVPSEALNSIVGFIDCLNGYIDKTMPWKVAKLNENLLLNEIFSILVEGIHWVANYIYIFTPNIATKILRQFNLKKEGLLEEFILADRIVTNNPEIIYRRIEKDEMERLVNKWMGKV